MNVNKNKSITLVAIQIICISLLFLTVAVNNFSNLFYLIVLSGVLLGLWALGTMKKSKFHITPDVNRNARLVTTGPYKYIRHPMYAATIIICFGLLMSNFSYIRVIIYIILIIDLVAKLLYEESLLKKHFPGYIKYMKLSFRLIPFIF